MEPKSASEILVSHFRQILIWPLLVKSSQRQRTNGGQGQFDGCLDLLREHKVNGAVLWREEPPLPLEVPPSDNWGGPWLSNDPTYEEIVYFHPFVRDFLYGDGTKQDRSRRPLVRFTRTDVTTAEFTVSPPRGPQIDRVFDVPRVELYLCKPLVALLVVEIAWQSPNVETRESVSDLRNAPMTLAEAQAIQSMIREGYPPYFWEDDGRELGGNCPSRVRWKSRSGDVVAESDFDAGRGRFAAFATVGAEPPMAAHWKDLLAPLTPLQSADDVKDRRDVVPVQQIVDDRIPGMTYLAVDQPRAIRAGDFARLAFCDPPGPTPVPYSRAFLDAQPSFAYDRYWCDTDVDDSKDPQAPFTFDTRYLCSGYQFVVVGRDSNGFHSGLIPSHFRRMYFKMGLIAHYERAALLKFADDLSEALKIVQGKGPSEELRDHDFRDEIRDLQMTFLKFKSRGWFTEVSNQLQGQELFDLWRERLRTKELFAQVDDACDSLHAALSEHESSTLNVAAFIGLPIAIVLTAVQCLVELVNDQGQWKPLSWLWIAGTVAVGWLATCWAWQCLGYRRPKCNPLPSDD